jgi:TonB-dependent receptor
LLPAAIGVCGCLAAVSQVRAQDAAPAAQGPAAPAAPQSADTLQEVVVTGVRGSIERSLQLKKEAIGVEDSISAEDIGKFPDLNVAESLQRVPGVALVRSETGEGTEINVRGLGPDFTRVELDGMSGLSGITGGGPVPAEVTRGFDFQSIASELFQNATVEKSPTAATVEGGLAGTVKLETPRPLNYANTKFIATAEGNRGNIARQSDPRYFALASKNWDNRFGLLAAFAYSKYDMRSDDLSFGSWGPFSQVANASALAGSPADLLNAQTPRTIAYYGYTREVKDLGGVVTAQFRPSDRLEMTLDTIYTHGYGWHRDDRPDAPVEGGGFDGSQSGNDAPTSYTLADGAVTSATFPAIQDRIGTSYRPDSDRLIQVALHTDWRPDDDWSIRPFLGYADRKSSQDLRLYSFALNDASLTYNVDGDLAAFTSPQTDFHSNPQAFGFNVFYFNLLQNDDKETDARLDFQRFFNDQPLTSVQFGARYSRQRLDSETNYSFVLNSSPLVTSLADSSLDTVGFVEPFHVDGQPATAPNEILAVNPALAASVFYPGVTNIYSTSNAGFAFDPFDAALGSGSVIETTLAGYVMANLHVERLRMNFGLRVVNTGETSEGYQGSDFDPSTLTPVSVSNHYTNFLPAANLRYDLTDDLLLRATYSRTVTRPDLSYLNPSVTIESGPRTGSRGNPDLQPYQADQSDLGLEWYFRKQGLIAATAFVKQIDSLITLTTTQVNTTYLNQITHEPVTGPIAFTEPTNGNSARVVGLESTIQSSFFFLPGRLRDFGGILNYTYADSSSAFTDQSGARTTSLPGLSKNSYNAVLYFDNGPLNSRLAYAWRDDYLPTTAGQFGASVFTKAYGQLDYSINYSPTHYLQFSFQVLNLTNAQLKQFTDVPGVGDLPTNVIQLERRFILGARVTF